MIDEKIVLFLMGAIVLIALMGCSTTSNYKQVAEEVPHYGLSEVKTDTGVCYVYTERNEGVAISCVKK